MFADGVLCLQDLTSQILITVVIFAVNTGVKTNEALKKI